MRLLFLAFFISFAAKAQQDSAIGVPLIGVFVGADIPSGDMAKRFGPNFNVGLNFYYKTNKNWILGFEAQYLFGDNVNEDVVVQLRTPEGFVIDNEGYPADIRLTERGLGLQFLGGKVIPLNKRNLNSGLMITLGAGILQHKVHIYDANKKVAAIKGDLVNGYDRLTLGFSSTLFLGYIYMGNNRLNNFYFGIQGTVASTSNIRKLNYSDASLDTGKRTDILTGLRFGWIIPLYKKAPNDFYYN